MANPEGLRDVVDAWLASEANPPSFMARIARAWRTAAKTLACGLDEDVLAIEGLPAKPVLADPRSTASLPETANSITSTQTCFVLRPVELLASGLFD